MESVDLDMDDIFDLEGGEADEGGNLPSTLPDLPQELEPLDAGDDMPSTQDAENAEVLAKLKGMKGAGKKVVRRPQPKLDGARLTGERGIATLPRVFKDIKFKGRGHEAEDLRVIMKRLEHWGHRLFPMMPFDDVLERIEKLGTKNDVKTCIKKMRLDIPVLAEDFVEEEKPEDPPSPQRGSADFDAEEAFDEMMREEQEQRLQSQRAPPTPQQTQLPPPAATPTHIATPTAVPNGLTPEQREKMERNRRLAMEKRAARLAAAAQGQGTTVAPSTPSKTEKQPSGDDKTNPDSTPNESSNKDGRSKTSTEPNSQMSVNSEPTRAADQEKEQSSSQETEDGDKSGAQHMESTTQESKEPEESSESATKAATEMEVTSQSGTEKETNLNSEDTAKTSSNVQNSEISPDSDITQDKTQGEGGETQGSQTSDKETSQGVESESVPVNRYTDMDTEEGLPLEATESSSLSKSEDKMESEGFSVQGLSDNPTEAGKS